VRSQDRRDFLQATLAAGAAWFSSDPLAAGTPVKHEDNVGEAEDVSPAEDLMREHGVLKRVLLVYREALKRLETGEDLPPEAVADAGKIIRSFIEDYHEKLEEDFLFPRFRKTRTLVGLVEILIAQHRAGRRLTETVVRFSTIAALRDAGQRRALADAMRAFVRMYEPHEAREDTVLFPAFRKIVSANEYAALGEQFENEEHKLFGADGFEKMVDRVAGIEKKLGIYELGQFTPGA
jgi:hemerythrin-like domain-containing protein